MPLDASLLCSAYVEVSEKSNLVPKFLAVSLTFVVYSHRRLLAASSSCPQYLVKIIPSLVHPPPILEYLVYTSPSIPT